ncbi:YjbQ family protein [Sulfitobacter sp. KE34]|uniref:Secondary thiamine-phosphate synthase enzyme YjbQ n=1 Tax=Sulfitobacter faviae TaxID=1775881 RepID=A0AAX3LRQ5_9RHOB|nr:MULTISPECIES: secondary thiamine-phosphate synthase enzyme YjbQ [Sulfitobacter]MDF3350330.1 YjbQ family protein [Sulfitobacter sp. KE12]MDF3354467.1 YjbQ family protein [Sulfitobacter sp. KE27]MDF3357650.1 YjbQ family protein [Sulfitobacter sp. KE33]MDF3360196.1 YjbQ family protein [Sulfitobacter sp. Ks41]MDF3365539.1 YjbQ family protein [Sulfitobacter sp. Ks34]
MQTVFTIQTRGQVLYEFTNDVARWIAGQGDGLLTLLVQHTSASLLIQENADPDVQRDLLAYFARLVPPADAPEMSYLTHLMEGPDNMPAHIKASVLPVTLSIPVTRGRMMLGTWQGIYLFEHRDAPHQRRIAAHFRPD